MKERFTLIELLVVIAIIGEPVVGGAEKNQFTVTTASGDTADIAISLDNGVVTVAVSPRQASRHKIRLRLGGMPVAHGLGDAGGWNGTFNLVGKQVTTTLMENPKA